MASDPRIEIELLGAPQIHFNGTLFQVNRKRVRALLFYLAAEGKAVPRSQLAYLLWPDKDHSSASQNLSIYLSYLKNEFEEDIVTVTSDMISLSPGVVTDIMRFHSLISSDRPGAAMEALKLFRGAFLEGFSIQKAPPFEQWMLEMGSYWNNQFIETAIAAAEQLSALKRYEEALSILEQAAKLDPLQEVLCRERMRILSVAGNRSAVTRVYHDFVSLLCQELGIPPSPETAACYQKIISSDRDEGGVEADSSSAGFSGGQDIIFVGRQAILRAMAKERSNHFVLIQGKSGLGKTSLVNAYIQRNELLGITISFKQQEIEIPYFAIIKCIRNLVLNDGYAEDLSRLSHQIYADRWSVLCQFVPELNSVSAALPGTSVMSAQQIMEAFEQFFFCLVDKRPAVILIDDIHYSDASSLEVIQHLVSQPSLSNVQFFATFRPSLSTPRIVALLNTLQRESFLQTIELGKLESESMLELLVHHYPDIDRKTAQNLLTLADGNPFWMKTIINGLDSGYTEISGKNSLTNLFNYSLLSLSGEATGVLYSMAVLGESCDAALFAAICSKTAGKAPEKIYLELSTANLVSRDSNGTVRFSHSKIYEYVLSIVDANKAQISSIHYSVASVMEAVYGEHATGQQTISIADHFKQSDHPELCARHAAKAGAFLLSISNSNQAVTYYRLAFSYLNLPEKFDVVLSMYSHMLQLGQNYEASIYINNAITTASSSGHSAYALVFEALQKLSQYPEYLEVQLGVAPCYKLVIDEDIRSLLLEAKALIEAGPPNPFLMNHLLSILSAYYRIRGDYDSSQDSLWQIISMNITSPESGDIISRMLLYSAVRDLIVLMNSFASRKTVEVISLQEQIFHSAPIQSLMFSNIGNKALLMNLQGNPEEGTQLMYSAISEARRAGNKLALADALTTQALLIRKSNPEKSYSMNYEAYSLAKETNARYTKIKSMVGLVITSSSIEEAECYYAELQHMARQIGNDSVNPKLETAKKALLRKKGTHAATNS